MVVRAASSIYYQYVGCSLSGLSEEQLEVVDRIYLISEIGFLIVLVITFLRVDESWMEKGEKETVRFKKQMRKKVGVLTILDMVCLIPVKIMGGRSRIEYFLKSLRIIKVIS
jgi:hypothetical protein